MAAPTPKNPSTAKTTQTNMALSFTTANPDGYPIAYADDVWDAVEQNTAMSDVMEGTGQYDQKTINEQLAGKIGSIDLSVFERIANKVIAISAQSTDVQYPTAKLLYDSLQALANVYAAKANTYTKTEVDNLIASISTLSFVVVATLPTTDIQTNVIYLVPSSTAQQQNIYDEYIYSNNAWEHIGSTAVDLSGYELKINKVTSISAQSTDNQYPSAKLLYDSLQALSNVFARIADLASVAFSGSYNDLSNKPTIPAAQVNSDWNSNSGVSQILNKPNVEVQGNKVTVLSPQSTDVQYPSAKAVYDCCAEVKQFLDELDERVTRLEGFHYMITGSALQGTIVIELNGELLAYQVGSDHTYEFKYKEPIQTLDFRAANIVSVSFYDSDSLINLVSCDELFKNCVELIAVDFANKTFGAVISATDMFSGCVSLTTLTCPNTESWKPDLDFSDCEELTQASLESLIDDFLFTYSSGDHIITPNQIMWGRISHADQDSIIARATAKGWQLNVGSRYNISGTSNGSVVNITVDGTAVTVPVVNGAWSYGYDNTLSSISFANDTHVQTIDFSLSDGLSGITSLASAFIGCTALTSIVFTNCNLLNIANASGAFGGCSALANLTIPANYWKPDVSFTDSPLITYSEMLDIISGLYYYPSGTHTITWNTSTWNSFSIAEQLNIIQAADLKGWDTNSVSNIYYIRGTSSNVNGTETFTITFINDGSLTPSEQETITVSVDGNGNWHFDYVNKKVYSLLNFAFQNTHLLTIDFSGADNFSEVIDARAMLRECTNLTSVNITQATFEKLQLARGMFCYSTSLTSVSFSNNFNPQSTFDVGSTAEGTFEGCTALTSVVGIGNATFANCTNIKSMFKGCTSLTSIDLHSATFANATSIVDAFSGCTALQLIDLSAATFDELTDVCGYEFSAFWNCQNLEEIRFNNNLTFAKVTSCQSMFQNCYKLTTINLGNATFAATTLIGGNNTASGMFQECRELVNLDLHSAIFGNVQYANGFLHNCNSLLSVNLSAATMAKLQRTTNFCNSSVLTTIDVPQNSTAILPTSTAANAPMNLSACPLSYASMLKVANWLSDLTGYTQHAVTFNTTAWANLSTAQQLIISNILTNKNWACNAVIYTYYVRGTSTAATETFTLTYINSAQQTFQETITCNVDGNGKWEFSYSNKKIYDISGMLQNNTTITSIEITEPMDECRSIASFAMGATALLTIDFPNATFSNPLSITCLNAFRASGITTFQAPLAEFRNADTRQMFYGCASLTTINLSEAIFAKGASGSMFYGCSVLTTLSLPKATFAEVPSAADFFRGCSALTTLNLPEATFANATSSSSMFMGASNITTLNMPKATFASVTSVGLMFISTNIQDIYLPEATFASVTNVNQMFHTGHMTSLRLPKATFASVTYWNQCLLNCTSLTTIELPNTSVAISLSATAPNLTFQWSPLTYTSMLNIANWVKDLTGYTALTVTFKASAWNALSSAEQTNIDTILSGKNWNRAIA